MRFLSFLATGPGDLQIWTFGSRSAFEKTERRGHDRVPSAIAALRARRLLRALLGVSPVAAVFSHAVQSR